MGLLLSILKLTCPRCRQGKLFNQPFNFSNAFSMPQKCPNCELNYQREPGFYYGAMYIAYGISAWFFFLIGIVLIFGFDVELNTALIVILVISIVFFIYFFRLARSIWIHVFVKYDPKYRKSKMK